MRGEDLNVFTKVDAVSGSPPHARGRPSNRDDEIEGGGSPPHARGRPSNRDDEIEGGGSPPHARGRLRGRVRHVSCPGITPACAGKTSGADRGAQRAWDHPRMRGEDSTIHLTTATIPGSPPHARGRLPMVHRHWLPPGITPACAGKTSPPNRFSLHTQDHPRMRGEDISSQSFLFTHSGSPPHARGRRAEDLLITAEARITPACAGKTKA